METSDTLGKISEILKETIHRGDAEDIFGVYVASQLGSLDVSRQRIGKIEITNTLKHLVKVRFTFTCTYNYILHKIVTELPCKKYF